MDWKSHPLYKTGTERAVIQKVIFDTIVAQKVFVTPGTYFWSGEKTEEDVFLRTTFASASHENLIEAVRRLGLALKKEFACL